MSAHRLQRRLSPSTSRSLDDRSLDMSQPRGRTSASPGGHFRAALTFDLHGSDDPYDVELCADDLERSGLRGTFFVPTSLLTKPGFGVALRRHPLAEAWLRQHYRPEDINPERMKMADVPEGATLIENPVSKAPGFQIGNVIVLPGVPRIMQAMFEGYRHRLKGGAQVLSKAIAAYVPEGVIAKPLAELQARFRDVEIGSYPFVRDGRLGAALVLRTTDATRLTAAAEGLRAIIRGLGGEPVEDPPA